jgi:hypothetical protein
MGWSQKKPLDHTVYDGWQSLGERKINNDGTWIAYTVEPQEGDGKLVLQKTDSSFSTTTDSGASAIPSVSPSRRGTDRVFITSIVDDGVTGVETNRFEYSLQFTRKRCRSEEEDISGAALIQSVVKAAVHGRDIDSKSISESIQNILDFEKDYPNLQVFKR